jgi:hypothetical protein
MARLAALELTGHLPEARQRKPSKSVFLSLMSIPDPKAARRPRVLMLRGGIKLMILILGPRLGR